jgi:predicted transcriptional regulator
MAASALDIVTLLGSAQLAVTRAVEAQLAGFHGIGLADFVLLSHLGAAPDGRATAAELAAATGRTGSDVARALGPLTRGGEVSRDGRTIVLTDAGRQLVTDARGTAEHVARQVLFQPPGGRPLQRADQEVLADLLTRLGGIALPKGP